MEYNCIEIEEVASTNSEALASTSAEPLFEEIVERKDEFVTLEPMILESFIDFGTSIFDVELFPPTNIHGDGTATIFTISTAYRTFLEPESDVLFHTSVLLSVALFGVFVVRCLSSSRFLSPFDPVIHNYMSLRYHVSLYHILIFIHLIPLVVYVYDYNVVIPYLEEDIKWIGRESRLLSAILRDVKEVETLSSQIKNNFGHCLGLRAQIVKAQSHDDQFNPTSSSSGEETTLVQAGNKLDKWVRDTRYSVELAKDLVSYFEKLKKGRKFDTMFVPYLGDFSQMGTLSSETLMVKEKIKTSLKEMKGLFSSGIALSLEQSKSKVRNLLDRPIGEHEHKWVHLKERLASGVAETHTTIQDKVLLNTKTLSDDTGVQMRLIILHFMLLNVFMIDVQQVWMESEIEHTWLEEVEKVVSETQRAMESFLQQLQLRRYRWVWNKIGLWKARQRLKADMKSISVGFADLFESKNIYGFRFLKRKSLKSNSLRSHQIKLEKDLVITDVADKMRYYLKWVPDESIEVANEIKSLCNQFDEADKLLQNARAIRGRNNDLINSWLQQMVIIDKSTMESVVTFIEESPTLNKRLLVDPTNVLTEDLASTLNTRSYLFETTDELKKTAPSKWKFGFRSKAEKKFLLKIGRIEDTINLLNRSIKAYETELMMEFSVGLEEEAHDVVSKLSSDTSGGHSSVVVSILGMSGIGKTAFAKKIFNHIQVVRHFDFRAWVSVPQKLDDRNWYEVVSKQVIGNTLDSQDGVISKAQGIQKINEFLRGKKSFIILDNVSAAEAWHELKEMFLEFPGGGEGSTRILLTTRNKVVASQTNQISGTLHQLRLLTKEESWMLFSKAVPVSPEEEQLAKKIVSKCGGLPLDILRLRYSMLSHDNDNIANVQFENVIMHETPFSETFSATKNDTSLDPCLYSFLLFSSNSELPTRRLLALWVALELVQKRENMTAEEVAEMCLLELIDSNMIQVVKRKLSGKVKTCCLPIALRQLLLKENVSLDKSLARYLKFEGPSKGKIHVGSLSSLNDFEKCKNLHSFHSFDTREGNKPGEEIASFLCKCIARGFFRNLLVLDLEGVFRPGLPKQIGKLHSLAYLGLRRTYLENIPSWIGSLRKLQVLDVKHTCLRTLPSSIFKLQNLRHLYLNQSFRSKWTDHPSTRYIMSLQTLWGIFVDKDSPLLHSLEMFSSLKKFGLAFQLDEILQKKLVKQIVKLNQLQSLRIRSIGEMGEACDIFLDSFAGLNKLCCLELFGILKNSSITDQFPINLTDLTLSASLLSRDPMPNLGKLPHLRVLCLYSKSYTGNHMVCLKGEFPSLLVLRLWKLDKLETWEVKEGALLKLRELEIRSCENLEVPDGLKHLRNLLKLKLTNMSEEFATTVEQLWDHTTQSPSIITVNW